MAETATLPPPAETKRVRKPYPESYLWQSWHFRNPYCGQLEPHHAMDELLETFNGNGGWKKFASIIVSPKKKFSDDTLLCMRRLMELPDHGVPEYWIDSPGIDPTQEWVTEQVREFARWYIRTIGEPAELE